MNISDKSPIERIINAVMGLVMREGIGAVTIRKIARLARVNVAAVNYYFRSKNNIINEALKGLSDQIGEPFSVLDRGDISPRKKLLNFLLKLEQAVRNNPLVFAGILQQMFAGKTLPSLFLEEFRAHFRRLTGLLQEITGIKSEERRAMMMCQLLAGILSPVLAGDCARQITGVRWEIARIRRRYIRFLTAGVLAGAKR